MKKTILDIQTKKKNNQKITMLTAYDYPMARLVDSVGIDIVLVGDSLANVVLGLDSTKKVTMQDMLYHTRAVKRAVKDALIIGDMPYEAYQLNCSRAVSSAKEFIASGCDAVKLEFM